MPMSVAGAAQARRRASAGAVRSLDAEGELRHSKDLLHVMLYALVVMTVSRVHQHYPLIAAMRPGLVLVASITGLAVLQRKYLAGAPGLRTWLARTLGAFALVACLSALFGLSVGASLRTITEDYWKVLFNAFLLLGAIHSVVDLWFFVWAYVVGCGVLTWLALFVFRATSTYGSNLMRLQGMYTYDSNDLCVVLLIGLPLALLAFQVARSKPAKIAALTVALGIGAALAKSGSRGGFLGTLAVGAALLVTMTGVSLGRRLAFVGVVALALIRAAPPGYWDQMKTLLEPSRDYNWSAQDGRRELWKRGIGYMMAYPALGVGISNFGRAEGTISEKARRAPEGRGIRWSAPHNTFVQVGAELGVTGLALFSLLVVGGVITMFRCRRGLPQEWRNGSREERFLYLAPSYFATAMIGFAVAGTFVSHAYMDHFYILVSLMAALSGVLYARVRAPARPVVSVPARPGGGRNSRRDMAPDGAIGLRWSPLAFPGLPHEVLVPSDPRKHPTPPEDSL